MGQGCLVIITTEVDSPVMISQIRTELSSKPETTQASDENIVVMGDSIIVRYQLPMNL